MRDFGTFRKQFTMLHKQLVLLLHSAQVQHRGDPSVIEGLVEAQRLLQECLEQLLAIRAPRVQFPSREQGVHVMHASDRRRALQVASSLPVGDVRRRSILATLVRS